ncbi:hypothetical protein MN608_08342 [Microdochium nivale]|nr:hypothetical protein MN608_08342 [Microdochium nivale]
MAEDVPTPLKHYYITGVTDLALHIVPEDEEGSGDAPEYFRILLQSRLREAGQQIVTLVGDNVHAFGVWMRILHRSDLDDAYPETTIPMPWKVIAVAKKYGLEPKDARAWFTEWFRRNERDLSTLEQKAEGEKPPHGARRDQIANHTHMLLLPCRAFDHGEAFLQVTRTLAYNVAGHISELKP